MSSELQTAFATSAVTITGLMLFVWLVSLRLKDVSIIDLVWGLGFVLVVWAVWLRSDNPQSADWILPLLTTVWGLRLSGHLGWRNHGQPEDRRYREMRQKWGTMFPWLSLITVFGLQGAVMGVVSLPLQAGIATADHNNYILLTPGIVVWAAGLFFESVGDWQLARFRANPHNAGKVLDSGLWRYTRHPNYFGDFLVWWGLYLVAVSQSSVWWTIVGPIVMSVFLIRVSGVTLLEKSLRESRPGYSDYVARTNAFFPWMPAK